MMHRSAFILGCVLAAGCGGGAAVTDADLGGRDLGSTTAHDADARPDDFASDMLSVDVMMTTSTDLGGADLSGPPTTGDGPGVFVAVGYGGRRVRSLDDGLTWVDQAQLVASGGDDTNLLRTITFGAGKFVALGWRVMTSSDGKTWTDLGTSPIGNWLGAATYAKGKFVATGGYGLRADSTDAAVWTEHGIDTGASHAHDGLVFGDFMGGRFVAANDDGERTYSSDGVTWNVASGASGTGSTHVAFGNAVFVGIGGNQAVRSTDGGATWSSAVTLAAGVEGVVFAQGHFTAVGGGHVLTSNDGASWTDHAVGGLPGGYLAFGHGTYLLLTYGSIRRSTDGLTWGAPIDVGTTNSLEYIAFGRP